VDDDAAVTVQVRRELSPLSLKALFTTQLARTRSALRPFQQAPNPCGALPHPFHIDLEWVGMAWRLSWGRGEPLNISEYVEDLTL